MKLYIMRHCEAEAGAQMDPTRHLTDTGKAQAKMMGKWLALQVEGPEIVVESNFQRSRSTAKRVAKQLNVPIIRSGFLDPENEPEDTWREMKSLAAAAHIESLIAVTHGPLVEKLLAHLTGSPLPQQFHFAHGAVAHFETTGGNRGIMHWLVTPNVVARDEDELDLVTSDAHATVEAALAVAEACAILMDDAAISESAIHAAR